MLSEERTLVQGCRVLLEDLDVALGVGNRLLVRDAINQLYKDLHKVASLSAYREDP